MVNRPGSLAPDPTAPMNEATRPGLIKYLNAGAGSIVRKRRANAYQQMRAACGGAYRIDAEGPQSDGVVVVAVTPTFTTAQRTSEWYIQFSCVR